ncbi:MAG: isoprenylcysteine carboxylmethyltransferase family protein [Paracoccus sp. (in: a-proteobacteria)]|nr:isoprenylcysteine carboxylmethyltransferase family protein [Paracoccus sp. (in: a-proteobacteria)]
MNTLFGLPKFWMILFGLAGIVLGRAVGPQLPGWLNGAGWLVAALGLGLVIWAGMVMRANRTTVMPGRSPDALVSGGPFRLSRNPIYLGDALILGGLMIALDAPVGLVAVPAFIWLVNRRFIPAEEAMLQAAFGADYDLYRSRVGRWLSFGRTG